jgi:hypothetical protein
MNKNNYNPLRMRNTEKIRYLLELDLFILRAAFLSPCSKLVQEEKVAENLKPLTMAEETQVIP